MKSYTDINQSKKLAEILPIESADYHYIAQGEESYTYPYSLSSDAIKQYNGNIKYIPCWSLAALLEVLPYEIVLHKDESLILGIYKVDFQYFINYNNTYNGEIYFETLLYDDFVDACYEMIIKLHEQKTL